MVNNVCLEKCLNLHRENLFFIAAAYNRKDEAFRKAKKIMEGSPKWGCSSSWLLLDDDSVEDVTVAENDLQDVISSNAMIILHGPSTAGGMWVEMGIALSKNIPILLLQETRRYIYRPPIYSHLHQVEFCQDLNIHEIRSWLDEVASKSGG